MKLISREIGNKEALVVNSACVVRTLWNKPTRTKQQQIKEKAKPRHILSTRWQGCPNNEYIYITTTP
jgi:hypothetical protein